MCTASLEKGYYWNSANKTTASQKKQVRFAMKLPLFSGNTQKVCDNNENNAVAREQSYEDAVTAAVRQPAPSECWGAPAQNNTTYNYGGGMRRVQSANASRPRGAVGTAAGTYNPLGMGQKSRSHSQEARSPRNALYDAAAPPPSEQLPIPQCKNTLLEIARRKSDHTDLRRMYDYATWNMYDRIVTARNKKRMSEIENTDDLSTGEEGEKKSSSSSSKNNDKPSPIVTTATTSCNSSFTSSPNPAAIAKGSGGIIKTSGKIKTTATNKVQASTSTTTNTTVSAITSTQAMSTTSTYQQQATTTTTTTKNTNATQTSLHYKLRSIQKAFSSQDTDSSQGGTAATEVTSTESEYSSGSSSGCNSPATFPGFMMTSESSSSKRTMSQGSEDDYFIFQLDM